MRQVREITTYYDFSHAKAIKSRIHIENFKDILLLLKSKEFIFQCVLQESIFEANIYIQCKNSITGRTHIRIIREMNNLIKKVIKNDNIRIFYIYDTNNNVRCFEFL